MKNRFDHDDFPEDMFPSDYDEDDYDNDDDGEDRERYEIAQAIELERRDLNQKILFATINSLEKSWLWRFRSEKQKRKIIAEEFLSNSRLIANGIFRFTDYDEEF